MTIRPNWPVPSQSTPIHLLGPRSSGVRLHALRVSTDLGGATSISGAGIGATGTTTGQGQSFTTVEAISATGVSVALFRVGSPADNVLFEVVRTNIGTGTVVASMTLAAATVTNTDVNGAQMWDLDFTNPFSLSAATQYFFRATRSGAIDGSNYVGIQFRTSGTYPGGSRFVNNAGSWLADSTNDARFEIYGEAGTKAPPFAPRPQRNFLVRT